MKVKIIHGKNDKTVEVRGLCDCDCKCMDQVWYPFSTPSDAKLALSLVRDLRLGKV